MKKLTKAERHEIYKRALKKIESNKASVICYAIELILDRETSTKEICDIMPEFDLFNPDKWIWFDSKEEREIVLLFCIEMTRP